MSRNGVHKQDNYKYEEVEDEKQPKKWPAVWKVALTVAVVFVAFVVGLGIAFSQFYEFKDRGIASEESNVPRISECGGVDILWRRQIYRKIIGSFSEKSVDEFVSQFGTKPVLTGSVEDYEKINLIEDVFKRIFPSRQHKYNVLVSLPGFADPNSVQITGMNDTRRVLDLSNSTISGLRYPYAAYSPEGTAEGPVVSIDDTSPSNYINLSGAIVLMKIIEGISIREKVLQAERAGAAGVLLYADSSTASSCDSTVPTISLNEGGDARTPGQPSIDGVIQKLRGQGLPRIISQTISCQDAVQIKMLMEDGPVTASVATYNREELREVVNIVTSIPGISDQDDVVIVGANRNSLHGEAAQGSVTLLELAREFADALEAGYIDLDDPHYSMWIPQRTIILASWGGGDFGNIGVVEYLEELKGVLDGKVVAYIDLDSVSPRENLMSATVNSAMEMFVQNATTKVLDLSPMHLGSSFEEPSIETNPWLNIIHTSYVNLHYLQGSEIPSWDSFFPALALNSYLTFTLADDEILQFQPSRAMTMTTEALTQLLSNERLNVPRELEELVNDAITTTNSDSQLFHKLKPLLGVKYNRKQLRIIRVCHQINKDTADLQNSLAEAGQVNDKAMQKALVDILLELNTLHYLIVNPI